MSDQGEFGKDRRDGDQGVGGRSRIDNVMAATDLCNSTQCLGINCSSEIQLFALQQES